MSFALKYLPLAAFDWLARGGRETLAFRVDLVHLPILPFEASLSISTFFGLMVKIFFCLFLVLFIVRHNEGPSKTNYDRDRRQDMQRSHCTCTPSFLSNKLISRYSGKTARAQIQDVDFYFMNFCQNLYPTSDQIVFKIMPHIAYAREAINHRLIFALPTPRHLLT